MSFFLIGIGIIGIIRLSWLPISLQKQYKERLHLFIAISSPSWFSVLASPCSDRTVMLGCCPPKHSG